MDFFKNFFEKKSLTTFDNESEENKKDDDFHFVQIKISNSEINKVSLQKTIPNLEKKDEDPLKTMINNVKLRKVVVETDDERKYEPKHPVLKEMLSKVKKVDNF